MRTTLQMSITLPIEMADLVKAKVASGQYASESEVVREGLRALGRQDGAIEQWLKREVATASDALKAHPERAFSIETVRERLASRRSRA